MAGGSSVSRTMMAEEAKAAVPELEKAEIPWVAAYLREDIQDLRVRV